MSENNDNSSESNSVGSDTYYQSSRLNRSAIIRQSVLRPSVLDTAVNISASSNLDAPKGSAEGTKNPFNKEFAEKEELKEEVKPDTANNDIITTSIDKTTSTNLDKDDKKIPEEVEEHDERPDPMIMLRKNGLERSNLFAAAKNSIPRVETSGFVFGENVHERVVGENVHADGNAKNEISMNGTSAKTSDMLFSSVIQNAAKSNDSEGAACMAISKENEAKSLNDVAREYEESRGAQKRKYEEVETFTGEENEQNIVDINCKLFAFINSNWEERGRGSLRLNAGKDECSRVVFRTSGNLRLVLNTKVWAGMLAERPSQKSLRLTALDSTGKIKIFLVMGRPADITILHTALVERIAMRKSTHPFECQEDGNEAVADSQTGAGFEDDEDEKLNAVVVSSSVGHGPDDSESEISTNDSEAVAVKSVSSTSTVASSTKIPQDNGDDDNDDEEQTEVTLAEPSSKKKLVDDLNLLFVHMHHLLNEFRPHQARETLRVKMDMQKRQRCETIVRFKKHLELVR